MSGDVAQQHLRSTAISGNLKTLDAAGGTASALTKVSYPLAGVGIRQFQPETTRTTVDTIPAANGAARDMGWRMAADINADPVQFTASTWPVSLNVALSGATTGPSVQITAIAYVNGTEIGRGLYESPPSWGGGVATVNIAAGAVTTSANPRIQIEIYTDVIIAAVSLGTYTLDLSTNHASSFVNPGVYALRASRTASDVVAGVADTSRRVVAYVRRPSETMPVPTDTPTRRGAYVRVPAEIIASPVDSPSRIVTFPRSPSETLPSPSDTPLRVVAYKRVSSDVVAVPLDTPRRALSYARLTSEAIPVPTDTPARVVAYKRLPAEVVPVPTDTPTRLIVFRREPSETIPALVGTASRLVTYSRIPTEVVPVPVDTPTKLTVYGRSVSYVFQDCPPCPPAPATPPPALILVDGDPALRLGGKLYTKV